MAYRISMLYQGRLEIVPKGINCGAIKSDSTRRWEAADVEITFNYAAAFKSVGFDPYQLNGRTGKECREEIAVAMNKLIDQIATDIEFRTGYKYPDDYFHCNPKNAFYALLPLSIWCGLFPDGVFTVS